MQHSINEATGKWNIVMPLHKKNQILHKRLSKTLDKYIWKTYPMVNDTLVEL